VSGRELRELAIACACHMAVSMALRIARFPTLVRLSRRQLPRTHTPLSFNRLQHIARVSRRLCGGTCLSESLVFRLLAARHGFAGLPVTIGVNRADGAFRAHAWIGALPDARGYTPLWTDPGASASSGEFNLNEPQGQLDVRGGT
jgi:hypothetical protein